VLPFTVEDLHQLDPEDIAALFEEVAANPGMVGWRDPEDR
jgi:diadenosine tetraphosphate (Ap4A) HIT family hydrolase